MGKTTKITRLIFDGEPVVMDHFSGVGHYTVEMLRALDTLLNHTPNVKVDMLIHYRRLEKARALGLKNVRLLPSPFSLRISNGLKIRGKQPPLDLVFGKGIYIFPNYTSWPLAVSQSVSFVYDLSYEKYPQYASPPLQHFLSTQVWKSVKRASMIATISENSRNEIHEFYNLPKEKIHVYYPAVDRQRYTKKSDIEVKVALKKYSIDSQYILFVGNIEPRKNLVNLLLAYEQLPFEIRNAHKLLLVGAKGWQDSEINETIERLNSTANQVISPSSYVTDDDLPALMSGASVFVYPSVYEGFGIPPIEAMACGTPVVSADNSSLPEAVGDAALTVDAGSIEQISHTIKRIITDPELASSLIEKGYQQAARFSWTRSAQQLLDDVTRLNDVR